MKKYIIVTSVSPERLEKMVNEFIEKGYKLRGELICNYEHINEVTEYIQVLTFSYAE